MCTEENFSYRYKGANNNNTINNNTNKTTGDKTYLSDLSADRHEIEPRRRGLPIQSYSLDRSVNE